jgi:GntR family transcriptional regulator
LAEPLWRVVALDLHDKIQAEELGRANDALPSEQELITRYGAKRNAVRQALQWLVTRSEVYTKSGQGTFISPKPVPFVTELSASPYKLLGDNPDYQAHVAAQGQDPDLSRIEIKIHAADDVEAADRRVAGLIAQLRIGDRTAISRSQVRRINGKVHSLQVTYYPMELYERGAARLLQPTTISPGAVNYIEQVLRVKEVGWRDRLAVRVPELAEAAIFGVPDDGRVQVIEIVRTGYDETGRPIRVTATTYRADMNQFDMKFGQVPPEDADSSAGPDSADTREGLNA